MEATLEINLNMVLSLNKVEYYKKQETKDISNNNINNYNNKNKLIPKIPAYNIKFNPNSNNQVFNKTSCDTNIKPEYDASNENNSNKDTVKIIENQKAYINKINDKVDIILKLINKKKRAYSNKKVCKTKLLLEKQISEEIVRRVEEDRVEYKNEIGNLEEYLNKRKSLINTISKKFKEVEIYAKREFSNKTLNSSVYIFSIGRFTYYNEFYFKLLQELKNDLNILIECLIEFKKDNYNTTINTNCKSNKLINLLKFKILKLIKRKNSLKFIINYFCDYDFNYNKRHSSFILEENIIEKNENVFNNNKQNYTPNFIAIYNDISPILNKNKSTVNSFKIDTKSIYVNSSEKSNKNIEINKHNFFSNVYSSKLPDEIMHFVCNSKTNNEPINNCKLSEFQNYYISRYLNNSLYKSKNFIKNKDVNNLTNYYIFNKEIIPYYRKFSNLFGNTEAINDKSYLSNKQDTILNITEIKESDEDNYKKSEFNSLWDISRIETVNDNKK